MKHSIALDGPAGAGKSTLAKELARRLGYLHVDTGAMYRTFALAALRAGISPQDTEGVERLIASVDLSVRCEGGVQREYLGEEDVTGLIRTEQVSAMSSSLSAVPAVRAFLLGTQRQFAKENDVIMDGRDIGTVVLPDADVKIFLSAAPEKRAMRRLLELREKGTETTLDEVLADMRQRDARDAGRAVAPLIPASDAVMLDNSDLDFEGTVLAALEIIRRRIA